MKKETEKEKKKRFDKLRNISFNESLRQDAKYCIDSGLTIYPAMQPNGRIFLFVQLEERFKRLNDKSYSQEEEIDRLEYNADILLAYKDFANKKRDKNGDKKI